MKRFLSVIGVVGLVAAPLACDNPFASDQSVTLAVSNLQAPYASAPGAPVTVVLTVSLNGCERFDRINQNVVSADIVLAAVGTNAALGRKDTSCPASFTTEVHSVVIEEPPAPPFTVTVVQPRGAQPLRAEVLLGAVID